VFAAPVIPSDARTSRSYIANIPHRFSGLPSEELSTSEFWCPWRVVNQPSDCGECHYVENDALYPWVRTLAIVLLVGSGCGTEKVELPKEETVAKAKVEATEKSCGGHGEESDGTETRLPWRTSA